MDIKALDAVRAYGQVNTGLITGGTGGAGGGAGESFAALVTDAVKTVRESTGGFEAQAARSLTGQADLVDVVSAASNAEMMVDTVVTIRDKVIDAYNDIMKMPI